MILIVVLMPNIMRHWQKKPGSAIKDLRKEHHLNQFKEELNYIEKNIQENKDWDVLNPTCPIVLRRKKVYFLRSGLREICLKYYKKEYVLLLKLSEHVLNIAFRSTLQSPVSHHNPYVNIELNMSHHDYILILLCICITFTKLQIKQRSY